MPITFSRSMAALEADNFRGSHWGLLLAVVLLGLWGGWFFMARVGLYEATPTARLEVDRASHRVQTSVSGRVLGTSLVLGREVKIGQLLVELESRAIQLQLKEEQAKRTALTNQLAAVRREISVEERSLQLARRTGKAVMEVAQAKQKEKEVSARYTQDKVSRLSKLRKGGQLAEFDFLKARAKADQDLASLQTLRVTARRQATTQRTREEDRRATLERLGSSVTRITGQLATATATIDRLKYSIEKRRIRAPVSGRLGEISRLVPGAYLKEGAVLATIVPRGKLKALASFPPSAALGRIKPGQPARIRLHGFPWTQYGSLEAKVSRVASEASNGQIRVELELAANPGSPIPLQHGLPAEVEVEVERTSPAVLVLRAAGKLLTDIGKKPAAPGERGAAGPGEPERR